MSGSLSTLPNPSNWRIPGVNIVDVPNTTFTGSTVGPVLLIGQVGAGATATVGNAVLAVNPANVATLCGASSMLGTMYNQFLKVNPTATVYLLPLAHAPSGAVNQVQTITLTGPSTGSGVLSLYVAGVPVPVAVTIGQTATQIAANIVLAINASSVPVTAASTAGVVTVTTNEAGLAPSVAITTNYYGAMNNEATPAGVTVAIAQTTAGSGAPTLPAGIGNFGELAFDFICNPYTDTNNINTVTSFLQETWSPTVQTYGQAFTAFAGTLSALVTFGTALNDPYTQVMGIPSATTLSPGMPAYQWAAAYCGVCSASIANDPAAELEGLDMNLLPPQAGTSFPKSERNTLLFSGISTFVVNGGRVILEQSITTSENINGVPSTAWLYTETPATATAVNRAFINGLGPYIGGKLFDNGTAIPYGQKGSTPGTILAAAIAINNTLEGQGLTQDSTTFNTQSTSVKQAPGVLALNLKVSFAEQLRQLNVTVSFSS